MMNRRQKRSNSRKEKTHNKQNSQNHCSSKRFQDEVSASGSSRGRGRSQNNRNRHQRNRSQQRKSNYGGHASRTEPDCGVPPRAQTSTVQSESNTASDIPGYYYDEKAKLYFKIQSYNFGMVAPFITKDKIANQQRENQRIKDVKKFTNKDTPSSSKSSKRANFSAMGQKNHMLNVLKNVQCGQFTCENMRTHMIRHLCSRIQPDVEWDNNISTHPSLLLGEIQKMEVSENREKIVCASSLKSSYSQVIQLMTVSSESKQQSSTNRSNIGIEFPQQALGPIHKKIKTLCWAPIMSRPGHSTVLYTTVCPIGCLASIAYLSDLESMAENGIILFEVNLGENLIWSSAWNKRGHKMTIGAERKCCLIDVTTRRQWTFNTCDSDPLSQLFSDSCSFIYNGTRKGHILLHDMRAPEMGHYSVMMKQAPGVGCLRLMKDENYLLAGDFSGNICMWDQRKRKIVKEYKGLTNSHWQLPFHLDDEETLLTSTGSDSYTKIWDMKTGDILCSIPPMFPVSCDSFPLSFYSTKWANKYGNSALLVAMRNRFKFYTYKETL